MTDNLGSTIYVVFFKYARSDLIQELDLTGYRWWTSMSECPETTVRLPSVFRVIIFAQCVQTDDDWRVGHGPRLTNWVRQEITVWQQNKIMKMKWRNDKISKTRRDIKRALVDLISYKPKILISKLLPNTWWYLSKPKSWKLVTAL